MGIKKSDFLAGTSQLGAFWHIRHAVNSLN
jgi:hypothetical protein